MAFGVDVCHPPVLPSPRPLFESHYLFICLLVCLCRRTILLFPTSSLCLSKLLFRPLPHHSTTTIIVPGCLLPIAMSRTTCSARKYHIAVPLPPFLHVSQQSPFFKHVLHKQGLYVSFYHLPPLDLRGHLLNSSFIPFDHQCFRVCTLSLTCHRPIQILKCTYAKALLCDDVISCYCVVFPG